MASHKKLNLCHIVSFRYGVTDIVRTNNKLYDASKFTSQGFKMHELFFVDGTTPSTAILERFLKIAESAKGAVAVHCKAGLGRTGTLIACYLMKHYMLTSAECIGWMRVCRPGTVIGPQQYYLGERQTEMWRAGSKVGTSPSQADVQRNCVLTSVVVCTQLGVTRKELGKGGESLAGWANRANTVLDKHMERESAAGAAHEEATDEAADVLADLSVTGRGVSPTKLRDGTPSPEELEAAAATAPPGVAQGDGLNAQKHRQMHRNTSTGALRIGAAPPSFRRTGSEEALSVHALKVGRPAPTKASVGPPRTGPSKTVKVSIAPK